MIMAKDSNNNYVKIEDIKQQNNFNGISPIEFKGSGENLENYRIYGNTVGGESVGDRTNNLFDNGITIENGTINTETGADSSYQSQKRLRTSFIGFLSAGTYAINADGVNRVNSIALYSSQNSDDFIETVYSTAILPKSFTLNEGGYIRIAFSRTDNSDISPYDISNIMLSSGSTALPYEPCGYRVPVTVTNGMDAQTTNIYLPEQIKMVGDEAEYIDYKEQKQHRVRKNLLKNTAKSQTINGLTLTVNTDGSVTCNGRRENTSTFFTVGSVTTSGETILSGCLSGGSSTSFAMRAYSATTSNPRIYYDIGDSCMLNTPDTYNIDIRIQSNYACDHLTFYPMIRKADIEDDTYEPYIENVDLDVTLPALPTLSGTNTLSVETNTKPSKVWGKLSDPRDILYVKDNLGNILFSKYHEIEGEPPLIYKAKKAGTLIDYRIYGQTENGESVGDRTGNLFNGDLQKGYWINATDLAQTSSEAFRSFKIFLPAGTYTLSFETNVNIVRLIADGTLTQNAGNNLAEYTVTTQTDGDIGFSFRLTGTTQVPWDNSDIMLNEGSTALPYEPCGYRVPVTIEGKNLLQNTASSQTKNGVTFTVNNDGSVTCDGTASNNTFFKIGDFSLASQSYILTGCPSDGGNDSYVLRCYKNGNIKGTDVGNGFNINESIDGYIEIRIASGYTCDNLTFYPMIRKANIEDDTYEPYHDPINTNIYLPEQIKKVGDEAEYIDYGEQKQHRVRKNLLQNTAISKTTATGLTITVNSDKSVIVDGTTNDGKASGVVLGGNTVLGKGTFIISGCPEGGDRETYRLVCIINDGGTQKIVIDSGDGNPVTLTSDDATIINNGFYLAVKSCDNKTFYPMIRKADITDNTYEPYIENTELDVTLPTLPTLSGTNTLSVGTAVQPSKINIKGKIKGKIYGWHVDPDISNSSGAVTYLEDAREMFPASMRSTTFNYGSWKNAFFMPKPCMLKSNGKVDYYLDPNDYTKKLDGTTSDIANPNYDGNAMMQWPKIWFKYVKGVKKGQGYFYVANYKADGNFHCWCNYDSEDNEIDHFYTAIYNGTSFANYNSSKTYVVNDFAIYNNKLYKCNTDITTAESFDNAKWDLVSNTAPVINKMRSLSGIRLTNNNGNAQTTTTTEITRATANNTTSAAEWYIETFSDRLLINGLLVLMGKSLNTQAVFGRGLDTGGQSAKEAYVTGALNDKGLFWGVTENGNSGVKIFGMENFWGCCWHRTAGLITNNHAVKLKLTYGTKDGSTVVGYNQTGNGYIDNGISPHSNGYVQKMSYNKYGFMPAVVIGGIQSTYYADYHYQNNYTGIIYALFGGSSADGLGTGAFYLRLYSAPEHMLWIFAASLSCKPLLN